MTRRAPFRLSAAAVLLFALAGSASLSWLSTRSAAGEAAHASASAPSDNSLFQLESSWTTDTGTRIGLRDLGGRFLIAAMIFTRCPGACPTLVRELQTLEKALPREVSEKTAFVLVTIDPEYDSIPVLHEYRKKMSLGADKWTLLRGEPKDLRELAATLGFDYQPNGAVGFAHSRLVTVLDPGGEIIHQQAEVAADSSRLIAAIQRRL